jgi:hypothetical protein
VAVLSANRLILQACVLTFKSVYDSHYIVYGYFYEDTEYVFAWETDFDEIHRAYSQSTKPTFYDSLEQNTYFEIQIDTNSPKKHYISDVNLEPMNKQVIFCGSESKQS